MAFARFPRSHLHGDRHEPPTVTFTVTLNKGTDLFGRRHREALEKRNDPTKQSASPFVASRGNRKPCIGGALGGHAADGPQKLRSRRVQSVRPGSYTRVVCS